jgi:hypothetical protein
MINELGLSEETAAKAIGIAAEASKRIQAETAATKAAEERSAKAKAEAPTPGAEEDQTTEADTQIEQNKTREEAGGDAREFLSQATDAVEVEPLSHKLQPLRESEEPLGVSEFSARSAEGTSATAAIEEAAEESSTEG